MDPTFDQNIDFNVVMSTLDEMLAVAPQQVFMDPASIYDVPYDTPASYDTFLPDAPEHHQEFPGPITPESSTHHFDQYDNMSYVVAYEQAAVLTCKRVEEEETDEALPEWRSLIDFNIPVYTQAAITSISQIQDLYTAYLATYGDENVTNATRMRYAKALSFALLTHYYPVSQGYIISPTSPGPIAKTGLSFILAADDASDIWKDLPSKKPSTRKRPLTKKEFAAAEAKDRAAKYFHGVNWAGSLQWDYIKSEDIASFVVLCKLEVLNEETGLWEESWKPHTYLSILINDFGTDLPALSTENTTQRSDVLVDALCRGGDVKQGYGMLLYGPRLEFYHFDAGEEWVWYEDQEEDGSDMETKDVEPRCEGLEMDGRGMQMDLRSVDLYTVDGAFGAVARVEVRYRDEGVDGVKVEGEEVDMGMKFEG
jgi:hypothetical protein